jgi:hypothetical protein
MSGSSKIRPAPALAPLAASAGPRRLVQAMGLVDTQGEPVFAIATGGSRRPLLLAFASAAAAVSALQTTGGGT